METAIGIACSVIGSVLAGIILRKLSKAEVKEEKREAERIEREELTLEALTATFSVSKELVRCVRGEKPNGELTDAFKYQTEVKHKIDDYLRKKGSQ
jgi:hypothetical protein